MDLEHTVMYNKVAKRHGLRIRTVADRNGYRHFLNQCMWSVVTSAQEQEAFYLIDGLHLNDSGKIAVVDEWIGILRKAAIPTP